MTNNQIRNLVFLVGACICFGVAVLIGTDTGVHDGNYDAWLAGGLLSFALAHLP